MCNPAIIAGAGLLLSVGQQVTQYVGQQHQAAQAVEVANLNYANRYNTIQQQATQAGEEHSQKVEDTAIAAARSQGRIAASASAQGLGANTIASNLNADMFGLGRNSEVDDQNYANQREQLGNEQTGADIERRATIAQHPKPSAAALALGIGGAVMGAGSQYASLGGKF